MSDTPATPSVAAAGPDRADRAAFKDLCIDVNHPAVMADFWSEVLGLRVEERNGDFVLRGEAAEQTIWLNAVPEARSVKNRVHLDVHTAAISRLVSAGARVVDTSLPWTVLTDPEGGEFCGFVRSPEVLPGYRLYELVVDAADPGAIATWWADRLGLTAQPGDGEWSVGPGSGLPWEVVFGAVPEAKAAKNRIHWDVWGDPQVLLDAGATLLRRRDAEIGWDVLADPEGNEFCVFDRG
jgi:Glyoxalase-like domain